MDTTLEFLVAIGLMNEVSFRFWVSYFIFHGNPKHKSQKKECLPREAFFLL